MKNNYLIKLSKLIKRSLIRIINYFKQLNLTFLKRKVSRHKNKLNKAKKNYVNFEEILFVFQTHNKANFTYKLLKPFLENKVKNIVAFADGCIDNSAFSLHKCMNGENHYVIQVNDLHEISNYRFSLNIAENLNCKYILCLQDDDLYRDSLFDWIRNAIKLLEKYNASLVGGLSGMNICDEFQYKMADENIVNSEFKLFSDEFGNNFYQLGDIEKGELPKVKTSNDASCYEFVASANRSPQLINVKVAKKLGFFPKELEPYQYDDLFNCFTSWKNNYKVILAPLAQIKPIGIGGMRLFNNVNVKNRPIHFSRNWNFIISNFGNIMNNGNLKLLVDKANNEIKKV
tara:strand:- start:643 stop:1674 length:1032 start_codon:yes stop_codon:yes gene_type:complete